MSNFIAVVIILAIVGFAAYYIIRTKKRGRKCIGCPDSGRCCGNGNSSCGGCSGCGNG